MKKIRLALGFLILFQGVQVTWAGDFAPGNPADPTVDLMIDPTVDPLEEVDAFLGFMPLEQAFHAGNRVRQSNESCLSANLCDRFETWNRVEAVTESVVRIATFTGDLKKSESKIDSSDWDKNHGNLVRIYIAKLASYGFRVSVNSITTTTYSVLIRNAPRALDAREIRLSAANGVGMSLEGRLIVTRELGGLGQILLREEARSGSLGAVERFGVLEFEKHAYFQ